MECKDKSGLTVLPVFYDVHPSDVRKQRGSFEDAFAKHELRYKDEGMQKVQAWRTAMTAAACRKGYVISDGDESKNIQQVVTGISSKLCQNAPLYIKESQKKAIEPAEVIPDPVSVLQRIENEYDLSEYHKKNIKLMKTELWFLGKFLLLERGDLQIKIESVLKSAEVDFGSDSKFNYSYVLQEIEFIRNDISDKCGYFETTAPAVTTTPLTHEPVVEYIDNVVQNAKDLVIVRLGKPLAVSNEAQSSTYASAKAQVELVEKELRALRNFVCFLGKICSSEQEDCWQTLLRHADYVATCVAITFYINMGCSLPDKLEEMIQHTKLRVRVICTDVLRYLKSSSGTLVVVSPIEAADEFMQTLQQMSMELTESSFLTVHQKESLAEQLNSLRICLNELPLINDIQDEMKMRFFKRLSSVVIHAAFAVYSFGDSNKEDWHQQLLVILDMIRSVKMEIYQKIREWVTSHLPKNDKLAFSNHLLNSFKEFLSVHSDSLASVKNQLELVHEELTFFEPSVMRVAEQGNNKQRNELENLVGRVIDKAFEAEYILDSFAVREVPLTYLKVWLSEIIKEIKLIKTELTKSKEKNMTSASNATNEELVGFGDIQKTIRDQLVGGLKELDVVSIVGMAGSGKTTLARSFINDDIIVSHFDFWAECRVSQEYTREDLLLSILISANCIEPTEICKKGADELADRLRKILLPKRYLLIIDDVWEVKAWDDLKLCFPDNRKGSRIMTSRLKEVAVHAKCVTEPHYLRSLEEPESWLLLKKRVFGQEICPEELKEVGKNIAKKCNGLPLSVVIVAGLLAKMDKTERCWTRMELSFGETVQDGAKDLVKLSYDDLPYKLKHCFLYFGAFLEGREISVSKLTSLWIAEAFIKNEEEKCLEDMAEDYLEDLIGRNLVMVTKRRSTGKIKACRVHDLILDFCKEKAKEDNFLLWLKRDQDANYPHFYFEKPVHRRLSFCSNQDDLSGWRPLCSHARSMLFRELSDNTCSSMGHASIIFGNFKFLRVLDLEFVDVKSFPTELKHLRYLAVQTTESSIPSSIENLSNLQTFIVKRNQGQVLLPDTVWKLSKLRNLSISDSALFDLSGVRESLDESLYNLATLSSIYVSRADNIGRIAGRTPNLRKLRCIFADSGCWGENENRFPVLDSLSQLETLKVVFTSIPMIGPSRLNFPMNLKKLTLCKFRLPPAEISIIANLFNLEVLKLQQVAFEMDEWEVRDNEFPQLKFLELENLKLSKWIVSDEAFSFLTRLVLDRCLHLEAIPDCFEDLGYLQYIEVKSCSEDVAESVRNIKETRVDNGHKCDMKVFS